MSKRGKNGELKDFEDLKNAARSAFSALNSATNFSIDRWFAKLKDANYLSKFMSWFNKNKMNEKDFNDEELLEDILDENGEKIPVFDKRKFNGEGERMNAETEQPKQSAKQAVKSQRETELENRLVEETVRREAAEAKLVGVQAKFEEVKNNLEKETAEMRGRLMKTLEDRAKQGQFNFLTTLLPVLDNLNLGIKASETDSSFEHLLTGVKGTARSFEQALMNVGVEPIQSVGAEFNPELHEAVEMIESSPENDGKIVGEFSRGYKFGDKLLRPSRVQVGKALAQTAGE